MPTFEINPRALLVTGTPFDDTIISTNSVTMLPDATMMDGGAGSDTLVMTDQVDQLSPDIGVTYTADVGFGLAPLPAVKLTLDNFETLTFYNDISLTGGVASTGSNALATTQKPYPGTGPTILIVDSIFDYSWDGFQLTSNPLMIDRDGIADPGDFAIVEVDGMAAISGNTFTIPGEAALRVVAGTNDTFELTPDTSFLSDLGIFEETTFSFDVVYSDGSQSVTVTLDFDIMGIPTPLDDMFAGTDDDDYVYGLAGDDVLLGGAGCDALHGDDGDDILRGSQGDDLLDGGAGDDILFGGTGWDSFTTAGDDGNDIIRAGGGDDYVGTNQQHIHCQGQRGPVRNPAGVASTDDGDDIVYMGSGHDWVELLGGTNLIGGGDGNDGLHGGVGTDTIFGGAGYDVISGGLGHDVIWSGTGDDVLAGDTDLLVPVVTKGASAKTVVATGGNDTFVFAAGHGEDVILDFGDGRDEIDLSRVAGFNSFADVQEVMYETTDGVIIEYTETDTILLVGVRLAEMTDNDFIL